MADTYSPVSLRICPHSRPARLDHIAHPLTPNDEQLAGLDDCAKTEAVAAFAVSGSAYHVRIAEESGSYDELGRLRLTVAELEEEILRLRHRLAELEAE